jgi:hypothetical protein
MGSRKLSQSGQAAAEQGAMAQQPSADPTYGFGSKTAPKSLTEQLYTVNAGLKGVQSAFERETDPSKREAQTKEIDVRKYAIDRLQQQMQMDADMSRESQPRAGQQAYDSTSQAYNQASQTRNDMARQGDQERASFMVAPQYRSDQERTATRAQPSTSSYQQMHMKMLQDRARNNQGPMVQQDTANDQRMNMERQAQQEREMLMQERERVMQERAAAERSRGRRRFSWQR